jgi:hypothetical protein
MSRAHWRWVIVLPGLGSTVAARIGFDERIFTDEMVATGMGPVFLAARAAMQKQERLSRAFSFVIHLNAVQLNAFGFHDLNYPGGKAKKQSGKSAW